MRTGSFLLPNRVVLAPMAGVTDRPFRQLCRRLGAGLTVSEMVTSDPRLRTTRKTLRRIDHSGEPAPRSVQIAGSDPAQLADAARFNVARGADVIDINMGCPAKKVCNVAAGSALLSDETLVGCILDRVVAAVDVPVTLKIRTGPSPDRRNAVRIARIAESAGVAAVAVHGRTRKCAFRGTAEYDSIRAVKRAVSIPVIANGDITSLEQARRVLSFTGADAVMIGRAGPGQPLAARRGRGVSRVGHENPAAGHAGTGRGAPRAPARAPCVLRRCGRGSGRPQAPVVALPGVSARRTVLAQRKPRRVREAAARPHSGLLPSPARRGAREARGVSSSGPTGSPGPPDGGCTPAPHLDVPDHRRSEPLRECVKVAVEDYLHQLDGHDVSEFFSLVMTEVEAPLLEAVLAHANGNQSRAAAMLGINRATLRKKLRRYNLI